MEFLHPLCRHLYSTHHQHKLHLFDEKKYVTYIHIFNQYSNIQNYLGNLNDPNVWYVKVRKKNSGYLPGWRSILSYPSCVSLLFNFCSHRVRSGYIGISTLRWYILFVSWPHPIIFNLVKTILFFPFGYCNVTESKEMVSILFVGNLKFLFFMPFYILFKNKKRALHCNLIRRRSQITLTR